MMIIIKEIITSVGEDVKKLGPSYIAGRNVKQCSCFGKQFLRRLTTEFPYDPIISLIGI